MEAAHSAEAAVRTEKALRESSQNSTSQNGSKRRCKGPSCKVTVTKVRQEVEGPSGTVARSHQQS
eukprot:5016197-Amphidinium_carterae.1